MDWMEFLLSFPGFVAVMLVICVFVTVITEMIRWAYKLRDNEHARIDKSWDSIEKTHQDIEKEGL